uniref:Uncharacterized protein n=1 Tax=Picea glauca TaxID=3330 RepID=A0A101LUP9_PICGL|nr:hypothetical protein ABT39_MTgene2536 [Picea glauca]QHR89681.1 hypothetical protein Q903MT_gene3703 [Picea sitchensis]
MFTSLPLLAEQELKLYAPWRRISTWKGCSHLCFCTNLYLYNLEPSMLTSTPKHVDSYS